MRVWVFLIFVAALLLRVINLSQYPFGFTPDEASFGYDAYSILKTGADQWGQVLPMSLKSFGDQKMPLYSYLAIPFVYFFGLDEFSVRLVNAILGSLACLALYFLVIESIGNKKVAFLSMALFAFSPWHIALSRGAFEANLTTFFLPISILFFLRGIGGKKYYLLIAAVGFGLNLFTYHTARLLTPLILIFLIFAYRKKIAFKKDYLFFLIIGFFLVLALSTYFFGAGSRFTTASIFKLANDAGGDRYLTTLVGLPDPIARVFSNKASFLFRKFIGNYLSYFSPQFLWTNGPNEGTYGMLPGWGVLPFFEIFFLGAYIYRFIKKPRTFDYFLIFWLVTSPLPAAISLGPGFAANRVAFAMPAIQIASAWGGIYLFEHLFRRLKKELVITLFAIMFLVSFFSFLRNYFFLQPVSQARAMIYGTREVFEKTLRYQHNYEKVVISKSISEPHIYYLFYNKIDPNIAQEFIAELSFSGQYEWVDQIPEYGIDKYIFKGLNYREYEGRSNYLLVGSLDEFPSNVDYVDKVDYPDGKTAFVLVDSINLSK